MSTINGEGGGEATPQQIVINGESYDPTEAQELLGKGKLAREFEAKWNSPIDSLASAYGKSQTELQTERTQRAELQRKLEAYEQKKQEGTETPLDTQKAREAARKLGFVLNEDIEKGGYIKRDDLPKYFEEYTQKQETTKKILSEVDDIVKEASETEGKPKVKKDVLLAYMGAFNLVSAKEAYEKMYAEELAEWKQKQVEEKKKPSLKTFRTGGGVKSPNRPKIDDSNLSDALGEMMS